MMHGSREKGIVFTIYDHGSHLGHVILVIKTFLLPSIIDILKHSYGI